MMGAVQEAGQRAMGPRLGHAVQIEARLDLAAAARQFCALALAERCERRHRRFYHARRRRSGDGRGDGAGLTTGAAGDARPRRACAFAARCFLSGLTCLATVSRARALPRSARGGAARDEAPARADGTIVSLLPGGTIFHRPLGLRNRVDRRTRHRQRDRAATATVSLLSCATLRLEPPACPDPCWNPWRERFAETVLRSSPRAAGPAPAASRRAPWDRSPRHQHDKVHGVAQPPRDPAGIRACAEIEIGARGSDDGRAVSCAIISRWNGVLARSDSIGSSPSMKNGVP